MDVLNDKIIKTRKPHQCFACGRSFATGTIMRSQTHTYDGIQTVYNCETCGVLMNEFNGHFLDSDQNIYPAGCVYELYHDYKVNNPEDLLNSLRKTREKEQKNENRNLPASRFK